MRYVLALLGLLFAGAAQAQDAMVVTTCGTLPQAYPAGSTRLPTVDTTGKLCGTGGGGAGNPGGSNTQLQYNNGGSFGGITGATSNGTSVTLTSPTFVTPALGTPASGVLTNATGYPLANLTGGGTGVLAALAINIGSVGAPVLFNGALGTPSSGTLTNATGLPLSTGITGFGANCATFLGTPSSANLIACLTDETGTGANVFGTAPTISSPTINTAATLGFLTGGGTQCVTVSNTGAVGATACAGGGSVTTITPGAGLVSSVTAACSQTNITVTGTLSAAECPNAQTGTTYTFLESDRFKLVTASNTASQAYTLPQSTAAVFVSGWSTRLKNINTGPVVITPTTSTINGAASLTVLPGIAVKITADGTNYTATVEAPTALATQTLTGANPALISSYYGSVIYLNNAANQVPTLAQATTAGFTAGWYSTFCNIGAGTQTITPTTSTIGGAATYVLRAGAAAAPVCVTVLSDGTNYLIVPEAPAMGSNVPAALATTLSAAGGLSTTVASGTSALGTSAIGSAACATAVTTAATNTATTDVIWWGFNGDPTAVTGYVPLTSGMLTIIAYPSANNVNFKVCNNTTGSITPGAITLNWRVIR